MNQGGTSAPVAPAANAGGDDYLDKGLAAAQKKYGGAKYGDPNKTRGINEKVTDALRGFFQKITGKKVPSKFSN